MLRYPFFLEKELENQREEREREKREQESKREREREGETTLLKFFLHIFFARFGLFTLFFSLSL